MLFFITQLKLLGAVLRDPNVDDGADFVFAGFTGREIQIRGRRGVGIAARRPLVLRVHERQRLFGLEAQRTAVDAGHQARAHHLVGRRLVVLALDLDQSDPRIGNVVLDQLDRQSLVDSLVRLRQLAKNKIKKIKID